MRFLDAGESEDFHEACSYTPPTGVFIDCLIDSVATDFVGEYQTKDEALDYIFYYIYEIDVFDYVCSDMEIKGTPKYKKRIAKDGTEFCLNKPEDLYDILIYEMNHRGKNIVKPIDLTKTNETIN